MRKKEISDRLIWKKKNNQLIKERNKQTKKWLIKWRKKETKKQRKK